MELETRQPAADLLTQDDIGRLLVEASTEGRQTTILRTDGFRERRPQQALPTHDFRQPAFLSPNQWHKLRLEQEEFADALAGRLSNYLRLDVGLRLARLETEPYRDFISRLVEPSHLAIFKLEPLRGLCLLEIHPHLGLSIVDRLLGGPGQASSVSRDLSEIEKTLLDQALLMVLGEWCQHWAKLQELRPTILGHETSGRYLQVVPPDATLLVQALELRLGNCVEALTLAFPCATLEPLIRQMSPSMAPAAKDTPRPAPAKPKWNPDFDHVAVPLAAAWPARQLSARQLTQLKVGDVLEWDSTAATQVSLRLAQTAKFTGRLGTKNGRWAVEITGLAPARPL
jgi:flagellar motor switch protein FliM